MEQKMIIDGNRFTFVDTIDSPIAIADSWVKPKNKIGDGNGESKLYISSKEKIESFFGGRGFEAKCFILKKDMIAYMNAIHSEYLNPSQNYRGKEEMGLLWRNRLSKIESMPEIIEFYVKEQTQIEGERGYVNSKDDGFQIIREISLPLVSYISTMHLLEGKESIYYWRLFADFEAIEKRKAYIDNYGANKNQIEKGDNFEDEMPKYNVVRKAREGQEDYRRKLLSECPFCPITMINEETLLIASHIKPWAVSDKKERVDPNNGLILSPLYDKLFDRGFITFSEDRRVHISNWLSRQVKSRIGIHENQFFQFLPINDKREKYLNYHRTTVFKDT